MQTASDKIPEAVLPLVAAAISRREQRLAAEKAEEADRIRQAVDWLLAAVKSDLPEPLHAYVHLPSIDLTGEECRCEVRLEIPGVCPLALLYEKPGTVWQRYCVRVVLCDHPVQSETMPDVEEALAIATLKADQYRASDIDQEIPF